MKNRQCNKTDQNYKKGGNSPRKYKQIWKKHFNNLLIGREKNDREETEAEIECAEYNETLDYSTRREINEIKK